MSSTTGGGPAVEVACAALRRLQPREQYRAQDYMVRACRHKVQARV